MKARLFNFLIAILMISPVYGQDNGGSVFGQDSITCIQNISLYREYFKQGNIDDAYGPWKWLTLNCPAARKSVYVDGVSILDKKIAAEKDSVQKEALIDTLFWLYDQRIKYFNEEGFVLGRKATDMFQYRPRESKLIYDTFKKSVELEGNKTEPTPIFRYFQSAADLYRAKKLTKEEIIELYEKMSAIIETNLTAGNFVEGYNAAKTNLEALFSPYGSCSDFIAIYGPKINDQTTDLDLLKRVSKLMKSKGCTDSDVFAKVVERLHKLEPSAASAAGLADMSLSKNQHSKALSYLQQAIDLETDNAKKADYYLSMADINFRHLKSYSQARTYAQKASSLRPDWGKPYILIGDMYASSSSVCGDDFEKQTVFWAAVDKYQKARSIDSSVSDEAGRKIGTYSPYMPSKDDCFFRGLAEGSSIRVECWIQESTTVRCR